MKLSEILIDNSSEDSFRKGNIKDQLLSYLKFWPWFLGSFVLLMSLAWVYLYYAPPYFAVNSSVMLRDNARGAVFLDNPVMQDLKEYQTSNIIDNEVDVIKSSLLVKKVLNDLEMYNNYFYLDKFKKSIPVFEGNLPFMIEMIEIHPNSSEDIAQITIKEFSDDFILAEIDGQSIKFAPSSVVNTKYAKFRITYPESKNKIVLEQDILIQFVTPDQLASSVAGQLKVETKDKTSSILYLSLMETVPQRGVLILNQLVNEYNLQSAEEKKEVALKSYDFINNQISLVLSDLNSMEQQVEYFKNAKNVVDVQSDSKFYQENSLINSNKISELQNEIDIYASIQAFIKNNQDGDILGLSSLIKSDTYLFSLMQEYNTLKREKTRLKLSVLDENPLMVNMSNKLKSSENSILSHIGNNKKALDITLGNLKSNKVQLQSRSKSAPRVEREFEEITRDLGIKKEHYLYLIKKKEETALFLASVPTNHAKIIDVASFSIIPTKPFPPVIYLVSAFFAFIIPFSFAYSKNALSSKISNYGDIKKLTESEILGELSYEHTGKLFAIGKTEKTAISEQLRLIRSNFNFIAASDSPKSILVTSSISGEGKTFFALNFAKSLTMIGKKVAVLEYDLRKKGLHKALELKTIQGISDYLCSSDFTLEQLVDSGIDVNGITFFQVGNVPEDPAELMYSSKNLNLINRLKELYDFVIIDTAPIGQVSDAFSLASFVDYTIYMVRYDYTSKKNIEFFEDVINSKKLINPLIVLNGSKTSSKYAYGHYNYN